MKITLPILLFLFILLTAACSTVPAASKPTSVPTNPVPTNPVLTNPTTDTPPAPTDTATPVPTVEPTLTATPLPTDTPTSLPPFFTLFGDGPIISKGTAGAWDDRYTDPGAVAFHDGQFHMFRNGFQDWPASVQIGYVTSPDGYTWTKQGDDPILRTDDIPYAGIAALASSVLVEDDGTWVLYFYTWGDRNYPTTGGVGRATAPSPIGPWTPDPELILEPGSPSTWDGNHVLAPEVLKTEEGYRMYYTGYGTSGIQMIGLATSIDGVHWEKYGEPVFTPGESGTWDASWVHQARVFQTTEGWVMIYRGTQDRQSQMMALGLATSPDGIQWERASFNPVLMPNAVPNAQYFWFTNALYHNETLFLFWEVSIQQFTEIYLSTHEGPLENP